MRSLLVKSLVVGVIATAMFVVGLSQRPLGSASDDPVPARLNVEAALGTDAIDLQAEIDRLRDRIAANPDDDDAHAALGLAYLRQATATAEPSFLTEAEAALTTAIAGDEGSRLAGYLGMASLANARHEFRASADWARRAIELDPHAADPHGLLGDALFQLGEYGRADTAYEEMVSLRPDVGSYLRVGYARSFRGDVSGAKVAMRLALQAAGPAGESPAFVRHQIGDIFLGLQEWGEAKRQNRIGTQLAPGYVPPTVGIAEAEFGRGNVDRAVSILERAVRKLPTLEYEIALGDLYAAAGRMSDANEQWRRAQKRIAGYRAHGMQPDVDLIVFYVDHGFRPAAALAEARAVYADRPTAPAADALAWALHADGRDRAAWRFAKRSLEGPAASPSHFAHAAEIASALGFEKQHERLLRQARTNGAFSDPSILAAGIE